MKAAGVDGCKGGWILAVHDEDSDGLEIRVVPTFRRILSVVPAPGIVCVDIPIGLMKRALPGGRRCDREARECLGQPRARSVFSPPVRSALKAREFTEAVELNRRSSPHRIGISRQSFGILPKIREVDKVMTPELQARVLEVHPEVVFRELNGQKAVQESKKSKKGRDLRLVLLKKAFERDVADLVEQHRSSSVGRDDIVDALAACWTAGRVLKGRARRIPSEPERDSKGLRMEIVG